jgi:hypothetical protein
MLRSKLFQYDYAYQVNEELDKFLSDNPGIEVIDFQLTSAANDYGAICAVMAILIYRENTELEEKI